MNEPFSRRQFVRQVGGAVLATSFGASLAAAGAAASTSEIGGTLNMVIWDGYDDKVASAPFRKKYGVKTQATYIGNNEQIFTKLRAGGVGSIDLVTPYHGYIKVLVEAGLLQPVDYAKLPNAKNYFGNFFKPKWNTIGGKTYSAPYIWGTDPMMYNARFIKSPPHPGRTSSIRSTRARSSWSTTRSGRSWSGVACSATRTPSRSRRHNSTPSSTC
jgi:spermidine/putrescine-binding protein